MEEFSEDTKEVGQVKEHISDILRTNSKSTSIRSLTNELNRKGFELTATKTRSIVKNELHFRWRRIKTQSPYVLSRKNFLLRQWFAIQLISQIEMGKIIVNFDESSFQTTYNKNYAWVEKGKEATKFGGNRIGGIFLQAAITSRGEIFAQLVKGTGCQETFANFLE